MATPNYKLLFAPADRIPSAGSTVTGLTAQATYQNSWLCDNRAGRGVRVASLAATTVTFPAAGNVNAVALFNSHLTPGATATVNVGGSVGVLTMPPLGRDKVPLNPWAWLDVPVVGATSATIAWAGHSGVAVLGEFCAMYLTELERPIFRVAQRNFNARSITIDQEWDDFPDYDLNTATREYNGSTRLTSIGIAEVRGWWEAQRAMSRPSVYVIDPSLNDACFGKIMEFSYGQYWREDQEITITLKESARLRFVA